MKKVVVTVVVLILGIGLIFGGYMAFARGRTAEEQDLRKVVVERGDVVVTVSATGAIAPRSQLNLSFETMGKVAEVLVEEGQTVKAGQLLARLDAEQLEFALRTAENNLLIQQVLRDEALAGADEHDLAVAQADLTIAQTRLSQLLKGADEREVEIAWRSVEQAKNSLWRAQVYRDSVGGVGYLHKQAEADVANAESAVRVAELRYEQVLAGASKEDVAIARAQVAQAQARLDKLRAGVSEDERRRLDAQVEAAQIQVDQARAALADAELRAPIDGVIAVVNVKENEMSPTGRPAFVLVDLSEFHIDVNVDEVDIGQVREGQDVTVTLDSLPAEAVSGHVGSVAPTSSVEGGVVSYQVAIVLEPTDLPLRAGMTANAAIVVQKVEDVLVVPNWAIRIDRETGRAYVEEISANGDVGEVEVELGMRNERVSQVISGVEEGDTLVVRTISSRERLRQMMGPSGGKMR